MKVVLFAGGLGSRIGEETHLRPKPMVEIGGKPILWHIMRGFRSQGFREFVICLGYKGYFIKEYFANYFLHNSDVTIDLANNTTEIHRGAGEDFKVTLVDTGENTLTAGRLKRVRPFLGDGPFMLTYGDGVSDIDLSLLLDFHRDHGRIATVSVVQPIGKFGVIEADPSGRVSRFTEKPKQEGGWINAGFFVLEPKVFDYLGEQPDQEMWEEGPMRRLVQDEQLVAHRHTGFWKCLDILRDKVELEALWQSGAPWRTW